MNKKSLNIIVVVAVIIAIVIIVVMIGDNKIDKETTTQPTESQIITESEEVREAVAQFKETLITKHQYLDGEHLFLGEFMVPNSCYGYSIDVTEEGTDKVINIRYKEPAVSKCPTEEPAQKKLAVIFPAPEDQVVRARINGDEVNLNIVEVPDGMDIEEYEI